MAIFHYVLKWCNYLMSRKFQICTDHRNLKYLLEQRVITMDQQCWIVKLMGFDYEIVYRPGRDNKAADTLSQLHGDLAAILLHQHSWFTEVHQEAHTHPEFVALKKAIDHESTKFPKFMVRDKLVWKQGQLVIPRDLAI